VSSNCCSSLRHYYTLTRLRVKPRAARTADVKTTWIALAVSGATTLSSLMDRRWHLMFAVNRNQFDFDRNGSISYFAIDIAAHDFSATQFRVTSLPYSVCEAASLCI